jgi:hypothetical protein
MLEGLKNTASSFDPRKSLLDIESCLTLWPSGQQCYTHYSYEKADKLTNIWSNATSLEPCAIEVPKALELSDVLQLVHGVGVHDMDHEGVCSNRSGVSNSARSVVSAL